VSKCEGAGVQGKGGERKRGKGIGVAGTPNMIGFELATRFRDAQRVKNLLFFRPICRPALTKSQPCIINVRSMHAQLTRHKTRMKHG
jgi:hypothetical protein